MRPWTLFLVAVAGWMNRRQQEVIEYLKEENRVLREKLGRKLLQQFGTLFSPDTILKWHRWLVARKYGNGKDAGRGLPAKNTAIDARASGRVNRRSRGKGALRGAYLT